MVRVKWGFSPFQSLNHMKLLVSYFPSIQIKVQKRWVGGGSNKMQMRKKIVNHLENLFWTHMSSRFYIAPNFFTWLLTWSLLNQGVEHFVIITNPVINSQIQTVENIEWYKNSINHVKTWMTKKTYETLAHLKKPPVFLHFCQDSSKFNKGLTSWP